MSDADETNESLPSDEITLIRPLLDEFKTAKRGERKHVVRKGLTAVMAARDISHLQPLAQAKIIARVKEVCKLLDVQSFIKLNVLAASENMAPQSWSWPQKKRRCQICATMECSAGGGHSSSERSRKTV